MKTLEELIAEQLAEQRKTNELLKSLVEAQSGTVPRKLSVDDEIRMVRASGQDIISYLKTRGKEEGSLDAKAKGRKAIRIPYVKKRAGKQRV
ncbi:MAG: hypothetical protein P4L42_14075 [Desulfocapsaceae bacterium]|nr:hypothetical protein [Desulfocapsaceae bacterium]